MRATISRIAHEAGVSTATVDRVLNDRDGVRVKTRDRVVEVANRLGYFGGGTRTMVGDIRMDFILPAGSNSFMVDLGRHLLSESQARPQVSAQLHLIDGFDASRLAEKLYGLASSTDAIGLVGLDHPQVREAIAHVQSKGVPVSTLVSDIPSSGRVAYVGIDNRAAGRLAALLLGRFLGDKQGRTVAVFAGSLAYRGHEEREMGFRALLGEDFPQLEISRIVEVGDDRERAYEATRTLLREVPPAAIYNIGAGNEGIARALQEARLTQHVVFIGHELTDSSRRLLLDRSMDAIIDQNSRVEAREIVKLLASVVRKAPEPTYMPRLQVIFRENIPSG